MNKIINDRILVIEGGVEEIVRKVRTDDRYSSHFGNGKESSSFNSLYKKDINDTIELCKRGGFTIKEFNEYNEMWNFNIDPLEVREQVRDAKKVAIEYQKRIAQKDYVGNVNVPAYLDGKAKAMINLKRTKAQKQAIEITIDTSYNSGYNAQKMASTAIKLLEIIDIVLGSDRNIMLKKCIVDGSTSEGKAILIKDTIPFGKNDFYSVVHKLLPLTTRGIRFEAIRNWHIFGNEGQLEKGHFGSGLGSSVSSKIDSVFSKQDTLVNALCRRDDDKKELNAYLGKNGSIILSLVKIASKYNNLASKEDITKFIEDLRKEVGNVNN